MAFFCTWTKNSNEIEVLVSVPPDCKHKKKILDVITEPPEEFERKEKLKDFKYNFIELQSKTNTWILYWNFVKLPMDEIDLSKYTVTQKPNFLTFTNVMPLDTWILRRSEIETRYYCIVGATVFCFTIYEDNPDKIVARPASPQPFLYLLKKLDPNKYEDVMKELREQKKNWQVLGKYDISYRTVDFCCERRISYNKACGRRQKVQL
eukprot:GHVP01057576.1.p1 GENE.GHVP01057576.1~~GHVP01057576.1.p1  ORF type:complete len:207 (+),score=25.87 GHVP01057576.1:305-925(+)